MDKVPHTSDELDRAEQRLNAAVKELERRRSAAQEDLQAIEAEMADAALESAITGDTRKLDELMERRRVAHRDIEAHAAFCESSSGDRRMTREDWLDKEVKKQRGHLRGKGRGSPRFRELPRALVAHEDVGDSNVSQLRPMA